MSHFNIIEINEMIDMLEDYANDNSDQSTPFIVGGIAGTMIFRHVIDAVMTRYEFSKILVIEGCQDYIGLNKKSIINYVYYADLLDDQYGDALIPYDPWKPDIFNPKPSIYRTLNTSVIVMYEAIIINNAHLIPMEYINMISLNFSGKIILVTDPFDINGINFMTFPCITDSLNKLSPILAMARSVYDIDSRSIDKHIPGKITEIKKINKRSIGKIDDKQYITNDEYLCDIIRNKQLQSPFRKNQKLFVTSDNVNLSMEQFHRGHSLTRNSMCVIESASTKPLMKLRIYSTRIFYDGDVSYSQNPPKDKIRVIPANILMLDESSYHRYNHSVLVLNDKPITKCQKYSILKNSNNLTVTHI